MNKASLQSGVNLGGWISQYGKYDHKHFRTFITRTDIQRISDWGFDHVRLPIDYMVLESDENPGVYLESGFEDIESCLDWCRANGLQVILDLHKAPGYAFDQFESAQLFGNQELQKRLINLWAAIAKRFGSLSDYVALELLNEIVLPDSAPWNAFYPYLVTAIRAFAPDSLIIVGGNHYNEASELKNLALLDDPQILHTFHFYLPLVITHYHAHWQALINDYGKLVNYPGPGLAPDPECVAKYPGCREYPEFSTAVYFDKKYLATILAPAVEFAQRTGKPVYCGEYGVIAHAPLSNRLNWTRDFVALLHENKIGHALWSYKGVDYGLVDDEGAVISKELVHIAALKA